MKHFFKLSLLITVFLLSGCANKTKIFLLGNRQSVLLNDKQLTSDSNTPVILPLAKSNRQWPSIYTHLNLGNNLTRFWKVSIGNGSNINQKILNGAIFFDSNIVTMDSKGVVSCLSLNGKKQWSINTNNGSDSCSGGVSYNNGYVFVSSADARILKIDSKTGKLLKFFTLNAPVRSAPLVDNDYVFIVNINNQVEVINHVTGKHLWTHSGLIESLGLLGGVHPVIYDDLIVVPYSSGEIYALHKNNGEQIWSGNLDKANSIDPLGDISHIIAKPIIENGKLFVISKSGMLKVFNLLSGEILWQKQIGSTSTPVLSGDYLFIVDLDNQLVCINKKSGKIHWVKKLLSHNHVTWTSPLLVNNRILLCNSEGNICFFSITNGRKIKEIQLKESISVLPAIVNNKLFILSDLGNLFLYK